MKRQNTQPRQPIRSCSNPRCTCALNSEFRAKSGESGWVQGTQPYNLSVGRSGLGEQYHHRWHDSTSLAKPRSSCHHHHFPPMTPPRSRHIRPKYRRSRIATQTGWTVPPTLLYTSVGIRDCGDKRLWRRVLGWVKMGWANVGSAIRSPSRQRM